MPLAARKPQPSDPTSSLVADVRLELGTVGGFTQWRWITANRLLQLDSIATVGVMDLMAFDEVSLELTDDLFHFFLEQIESSVRLELSVVQNYTEQLLETEEAATDPGDVAGRITNLELDLAMSTTNPDFYKEFSYSGDDIAGYGVYTSPTKITQLFDVVFTFTNGILTEKEVTRISDSAVLTVTYGYSGDQLISQTRNIS